MSRHLVHILHVLHVLHGLHALHVLHALLKRLHSMGSEGCTVVQGVGVELVHRLRHRWCHNMVASRSRRSDGGRDESSLLMWVWGWRAILRGSKSVAVRSWGCYISGLLLLWMILPLSSGLVGMR